MLGDNIEKVKLGLECHVLPRRVPRRGCGGCPYNEDENGKTRTLSECAGMLYEDACLLIDDMKNVIELLEGSNSEQSCE